MQQIHIVRTTVAPTGVESVPFMEAIDESRLPQFRDRLLAVFSGDEVGAATARQFIRELAMTPAQRACPRRGELLGAVEIVFHGSQDRFSLHAPGPCLDCGVALVPAFSSWCKHP